MFICFYSGYSVVLFFSLKWHDDRFISCHGCRQTLNIVIRLHLALYHHLLQYREKSINIRERVVGRRRSQTHDARQTNVTLSTTKKKGFIPLKHAIYFRFPRKMELIYRTKCPLPRLPFFPISRGFLSRKKET